MASAPTPDGYLRRRHPGGDAVTWAAAADWAEGVLENDTLHGWASRQSDRVDFPGRGQVHSVPAPLPGPESRMRWAVRHYRRGGAIAMHMEDRYMRGGTPRPFREIAAIEASRARGIRTPAPVAGATYVQNVSYRCDLVTEAVPDVRTLADLLHDHDGTRGWLRSMARAGDLIRLLGEAGVYHVDLNARNILLSDDHGEPAWVVDLDRARVLDGPSTRAAERMELRLVRSIVKIGTPTGEHLGDQEVMRALATRNSEL
ncbi:MAG: lipopolysaccharide kinase InaA family protein [Longimicrobiales bacterium]